MITYLTKQHNYDILFIPFVNRLNLNIRAKKTALDFILYQEPIAADSATGVLLHISEYFNESLIIIMIAMM